MKGDDGVERKGSLGGRGGGQEVRESGVDLASNEGGDAL
jgi:hypothetical protein